MTPWNMWKSQNTKLQEDIPSSATRVAHKAYETLRSQPKGRGPTYREMNETPLNQQIVWRPPLEDTFKCNVDVAFFKNDLSFGVGFCLRDDEGQFIQVLIDWDDKGEALGLLTFVTPPIKSHQNEKDLKLCRFRTTQIRIT